jgi:predicted metal-dependent hydrolase
MIHKIKFGRKTLLYKIIKSDRLKTSQIIVDGDGIIVRTPTSKSDKEIQEIVSDKAKWIAKKVIAFQERKAPKPKFKEKSSLLFLGKEYKIHIKLEQKKDNFILKNNQFQVKITSNKSSSVKIQKLYNYWLKNQAERILEDKIKIYSEKLDVKPSKMVLKNLKSRWGSATTLGVINLNFNLLKANETVVDYVVLHELSHLKIKEHNNEFWKLIQMHMSDYKTQKKWLDEHSFGIQ